MSGLSPRKSGSIGEPPGRQYIKRVIADFIACKTSVGSCGSIQLLHEFMLALAGYCKSKISIDDGSFVLAFHW